MITRMVFAALAVSGLLLVTVGAAPAAKISPQGYTFDQPTGIGVVNNQVTPYSDPGRTKLTDGMKGEDNWTTPHEPWVGWFGIENDGNGTGFGNYAPIEVTIDFKFAAAAQIGSVQVGTNQDATLNWNVVRPSLVELWVAEMNGADIQRLDRIVTPYSPSNSGPGASGNNGRRHDVLLSFDPVMLGVDQVIRLKLSNADNFGLVDPAAGTQPPIAWDNSTGPNNGMFWIFLDEVAFDTEPVPEPSTLVLLSSGLIAVAARRRGRRRT